MQKAGLIKEKNDGESRYDKMKKTMDERMHKREYIDEFLRASNKWQFMLDHPSIFFNSLGSVINAFSPGIPPNQQPSQQFITIATANITATTQITNSAAPQMPMLITNQLLPTPFITVPYKFSFTIVNQTVQGQGGHFDIAIGVGDSSVSFDNQVTGGTPQFNCITGVSGVSNFFYLGASITTASTAYQQTFFGFNGHEPGPNGTNPPQATTVYTIEELQTGQVQFNIRDNVNYTSDSYTTTAASLTGVTRYLFLYTYNNNAASLTAGQTFTVNIVPSVN